jgi:succinate-semialdehyde dehydrogenase/glutarate-semialdehyde dehydrogenase
MTVTAALIDRPRPAASPAPRPSDSAGLLSALAEWEVVATTPQRLLIDGGWREARSGATLAVEDPSTGQTLCRVADAGERDALDALQAASAAMPAWAARPPRDRARVLRRCADALLADIDRLAMLITLEMGKPLAESRDEVAFAAEYIERCAEEAVRVAGTIQEAPDGTSQIMVLRRPVGPCLVITPWNFPLAVPARSVAAALAAGCSVVLRPSSLTPLSALALAGVLEASGLPAGVLNVVVSATDGATDPLLVDRRLRRLTFTGSTTVGRLLLARSADQVLQVGVELGGQAPFVVFEDADLEAAVDGAVAAKMRNGAQACTAANRFHVHRELADEFTRRLADRLSALRLGRGTEPGVDLGPMIGERQRARLADLVEDAVARGARPVLAGAPAPECGHFFAPVVLADVPREARVLSEEIFGPIAPITVFERESELVAEANRCEQGLAAYLYTRDLDRAMRVGAALEVGMVAVNRGRVSAVAAPFGGVKQSGFGRSGGADPLDDYLETRYLSVDSGPSGALALG